MSPLRIDSDLFEEAERPIVHPDNTIGDTVELVPGNFLGARGPLREIIRTRGSDERAQLLTVTIVGSGVYESSALSASTAPRGPLVAVVEWGVRGARSKVELDVPQGGVVFSLVASYVQVAARYDGLLSVNGSPLDPGATGLPSPGPRQRVGAMVGYGSYGAASRLTRTVRTDDVPVLVPGSEIDNVTRVSVPAFARQLAVSGLGFEGGSYRVRFGTAGPEHNGSIAFPPGAIPRALALPGDAAFVEVENLGAAPLRNPAFVFELAI